MLELVVDSFAGGGGASFGIEKALGRPIDIAVNHDREAIAMHMANHPHTKHYCEDVWQVDPMEVTQGKPVGLAWFSPDCKHFSRAKGGKPVSKRVRGLAWIVIRWAKAVRPRVIMLENVSEFATWGPLLDDGSPCPIRKGFTFRRWHKMLENLGYRIDMREMSACDYGAPTIRRRLFIIARCDGRPIVWPHETHGRGLLPYRTAAECIDWSIPCPSIFERKKPLAEATLRRIARGITRYVVNNPKPFIVQMRGTEDSQIDCSARPMDGPLGTVSAGGIHHALVTPLIASIAHGDSGGKREYPIDDPLGTVSAGGIQHALITPIIAGVGGRMGQSPERPVDRPFQTVTAKADSVLISPVIMPITHSGERRMHETTEPLPTITCAHRGEFALIAPTLINTRNGEREGQQPRVRDITDPAPTVTAKGSQGALIAAFLARHYGGHENDGAALADPMHTVTAKDHHALVTTRLETYESDGSGAGSNSDRSDRGSPGRNGVEGSESERDTSFVSPPNGDTLQKGLFTSEGLHEQLSVRGDCSPIGLDGSKRADPNGTGTESRGRQQKQQSSGQSDTHDARQESRTCVSDGPATSAGVAQEGQRRCETTESSGPSILGDSDETGGLADDSLPGHAHDVAAFLLAYYGTDQNPSLKQPLPTITTKDRFALVTVEGNQYYIADIGMRMLVPRELFNAQSFPRSYRIDLMVGGKPLTKTAQVRMAGNSVCPVMAEALVRANVVEQAALEVA